MSGPKGVRHDRFDAANAEDVNGVLTQVISVCDPDDPNAAQIAKVQFPPGYTVGPHKHVVDYAEIILEGSQRVGRRWHHVGDVRVVKSGTVYGPLLAGPEGATVLIVFSGADRLAHPPSPQMDFWMAPTPGERIVRVSSAKVES